MTQPLTDAETIRNNPNSMRVKMELMIMRVQYEFCRALENEENPSNKFKVPI